MYVSWPYLMFLGYGQLLVFDESLTALLVLADVIEIAMCVIVLSETYDDETTGLQLETRTYWQT